MKINKSLLALAAASSVALTMFTLQAQDDEPPETGVFITSVGLGDGGNLGGLEGADAHCQQLAANAGLSSPLLNRGVG